jgi:hypothetical protein
MVHEPLRIRRRQPGIEYDGHCDVNPDRSGCTTSKGYRVSPGPETGNDGQDEGDYESLLKDFTEEINRNADSAKVNVLKLQLGSKDNRLRLAGLERGSAFTFWTFLVCSKVCTWDHKPKIERKYMMGNNFPWGGKDHHTAVPGTGKEVYYDIWSNIHFGYVGRSTGFSREELLDGSHNPIAGETDNGDDLTVNLSVDLYEKYGVQGLTEEVLDQAIRQSLPALQSIPGSEWRVDDIQ